MPSPLRANSFHNFSGLGSGCTLVLWCVVQPRDILSCTRLSICVLYHIPICSGTTSTNVVFPRRNMRKTTCLRRITLHAHRPRPLALRGCRR